MTNSFRPRKHTISTIKELLKIKESISNIPMAEAERTAMLIEIDDTLEKLNRELAYNS